MSHGWVTLASETVLRRGKKMRFFVWENQLLGDFFGGFSSDPQGRVLLSREVLDEEFADLGGTSEFLRTVLAGPDWPVIFKNDLGIWVWVQPRSLFERAYGLFKQWREPRLRHPEYVEPHHDAPPYLPYLCLL